MKQQEKYIVGPSERCHERIGFYYAVTFVRTPAKVIALICEDSSSQLVNE
jgi:hypothetical protein